MKPREAKVFFSSFFFLLRSLPLSEGKGFFYSGDRRMEEVSRTVVCGGKGGGVVGGFTVRHTSLFSAEFVVGVSIFLYSIWFERGFGMESLVS